MRAPEFWYPNRAGLPWQARLLSPLAAIYGCGTRIRLRRAPTYSPKIPVICVGNINAGGTGKTPTVIALAQRLQEQGKSPAILSRGYGGEVRAPKRVNPESDKAAKVGDEALLMAAFAPVWVANDRSDGAREAETSGAGVLILDDGFQDPSVAKSLSLVVIDAAAGFGNGRVIPAGPLREPVRAGLDRADAVVIIGAEADQRALTPALPDGLPRLQARLEPLPTGLPFHDLPVLAFAGIGRPAKFFGTLEALGAKILRAVALGDHQPLTPALMARLEAEAKAKGAQLVTTEKDAVRLPASFRNKVVTLPVRLVFSDNNALDDVLAKIEKNRP
ncbi:MAG: tetraacyldisaccharide 4'-kinase [Pseudomonadota bacterium]